MGSGQVGECVSRRSTSVLGGAYSRLPPRVRSVEEKIELTSSGVETSCVAPGSLQRYFTAFHGVERLVNGALDPSFPHKAPMDLVVAAFFTLVSHSLTSLLSVSMEAG